MDDDFSDDGFDDLNHTTLQELENNAIRLTQAQKLDPTQMVNEESYSLEDDDLDDTIVIDEAAKLPVRPSFESDSALQAPSIAHHRRPQTVRNIQQPRWQQPVVGARPPSPHPTAQHAPSSSSARLLSSRATGSQRTGPPPPPPPPPISNGHAPQLTKVPYSHLARSAPHPSDQRRQASQQQPIATAKHRVDQLAALQARVRALENDLHSARGEVSIIRSKYDNSVTAHEADIDRLKKQNAEALAKKDRLVEAAVHAEKAAATELHFTRQDLREELQKSKKGRKESADATASTPRKNRAAGFKDLADGFDHVEVLLSPSKPPGGAKGRGPGERGGERSGERTPSRAKRKRPTMDSPVTALEIEKDVVMNDVVMPSAMPRIQPEEAVIGSSLRPAALPYDLLRLVLDHGAIHGQPLTFDLLARYSFPSDPEPSFASIIFQKLPSMGEGDAQDPIRLLIDFCDLIIDLWNQCLREEYYEPIYDLVALVTFILQLNTISTAPYVASTLVPVAQTTVFLLAVPRFESQEGDLTTTSMDEAVQHLVLNIDTEGTSQLLYLTALGCLDSYLLDPEHPLDLGPGRDSPQKLYWKLVGIDFVLVMLSPKQPQDDFLGMLRLLCTSSLPDSIGPITGEPERNPDFVAEALIERVSKIMFEPLRWSAPGRLSGSFGHNPCVVRLAGLRTLLAFAQSGLGARRLALSDVAVPRLVLVLCGAIDALYDMDLPAQIPDLDIDQGEYDGESRPREVEPERPIAEPEEMQGVEGDAADQPIALKGEARMAAVAPPSRPLPLPASQAVSEPSQHHLLITIVSSIIHLLHTLVTDPATSVHMDMCAKLSTSHGASQKYLLALSRLNYAEEDLIFEAGIDPVTLDRANELLDLAITPDEADGVREVFGTWS